MKGSADGYTGYGLYRPLTRLWRGGISRITPFFRPNNFAATSARLGAKALSKMMRASISALVLRSAAHASRRLSEERLILLMTSLGIQTRQVLLPSIVSHRSAPGERPSPDRERQ